MTDENTTETETTELPKMTIEQVWTPGHEMLLVEYVDFNGEPDPDVEAWLTEHGGFVSWVPSEHAVIVTDYANNPITAHAGARIVWDAAGLEAFAVYHA